MLHLPEVALQLTGRRQDRLERCAVPDPGYTLPKGGLLGRLSCPSPAPSTGGSGYQPLLFPLPGPDGHQVQGKAIVPRPRERKFVGWRIHPQAAECAFSLPPPPVLLYPSPRRHPPLWLPQR